MSVVRSQSRSAQVGVERDGVAFDEEEKEEEDDAVEELLAGHVPLLVCRDANGEGHHENRAADERDAGENAQEERETKDGFEEWNGVAESVSEAVRQGRFREVFCGRSRERAYAVIDANEAVTGEVDAESDAQEGVGEGFVVDAHSRLRRTGVASSYSVEEREAFGGSALVQASLIRT